VGWFGYLCNVIHYVSFGEDGIGKVFFFRVGSVCGSIADLLVVYLLVFLGKVSERSGGGGVEEDEPLLN